VLEPRVPERATFQGGVFTRAQAYDAGHSRRQVRRWLEVGRWKVVAGAAVASADLRVGPGQLGFAAVLSWPGAVVSHQCAGALHGFPIEPRGLGTAIVEPQRGSAAALAWDESDALVAAGYLVLRFTWDDLTRRRADVMRVMTESLGRPRTQ
jgi:hypothetical protein